MENHYNNVERGNTNVYRGNSTGLAAMHYFIFKYAFKLFLKAKNKIIPLSVGKSYIKCLHLTPTLPKQSERKEHFC
jgi:hypothetical protein